MAKSRIKIGNIVTVKGKKYKIAAGTNKGKKYKATPVSGTGKTLQFGAKGYKAGAGTKRGNSYCARSAGIKTTQSGATPNDFARMLWNCNGKKSMKK
jgi:hypothetical protein